MQSGFNRTFFQADFRQPPNEPNALFFRTRELEIGLQSNDGQWRIIGQMSTGELYANFRNPQDGRPGQS